MTFLDKVLRFLKSLFMTILIHLHVKITCGSKLDGLDDVVNTTKEENVNEK